MKKLVALFWKFYNNYETGLQKIARHFPDSITPNFLTFIRITFIIPLTLTIQNDQYLIAALFFLVVYFLDALDGPLARVKNQVTEFGKIFDPAADKLIFLTVLFILGIKYLPPSLIYIIFSLEILLVLFVVVFKPLASLLKLDAKLGANIFGKIKMLFQALGIIVLFFLVAHNQDVLPATIIFIIATVFSGLSILSYLLSVQKKKTTF